MPNQDIVLGVETEFNEIANRIITYDKPDAKIQVSTLIGARKKVVEGEPDSSESEDDLLNDVEDPEAKKQFEAMMKAA